MSLHLIKHLRASARSSYSYGWKEDGWKMWFPSPGKVMFEEKRSSGKAHKAKKNYVMEKELWKLNLFANESLSPCWERCLHVCFCFSWQHLFRLATGIYLSVISIFLKENRFCFFPWETPSLAFAGRTVPVDELLLQGLCCLCPQWGLPWCTAVPGHATAVLHLLPSPGFLAAGRRLCRGKWGEEGNQEKEKYESMSA